MSITIKDVANYAGVSPTTVSRVMNAGTLHPVNKKTAEKVLKAIIALGYVPNENARKLSLKEQPALQKSNMNIGILLASAIDSYSDPFFHNMLIGIQSQASLFGYSIAYKYSVGEAQLSVIKNDILRHQAIGVIVLGRLSTDIFGFLSKNVKHIIYAGINHLNQQFDEVVCDAYSCAEAAVNHLIKIGYKKIGFVGNVINENSSVVLNEHRYKGYVHTLEKNNLPIYPEFIINTSIKIEPSYLAVDKLLSQSKIPEALFCANDFCAVGALKAINKHKLKVPADIALISIGDNGVSANPMISTIHIPCQDIGKYAINLLNDQVTTNRKYPLRLTLPYKLVIRDSCGFQYN